MREYPEYKAYTTPLFFCDDWLNLYLDNYRMYKDSDVYSESNEICCSAYRFVYMGEKGSWTPLHADVFRSYSWSANACGKKRWLFLSPSQSHLVFDRNMKSSVYNIFDESYCCTVAPYILQSFVLELLHLLWFQYVMFSAHTKDSAKALVDTIQRTFPGANLALVVAIASDKDHVRFARELLSVSGDAAYI
ncbi:hypothetical protein G4B88_012562 [Cannabis sativa]|uniref:JmjC domain-containing protein n=1 Tax=Cannabis sativa TaxID=3483 RepID=A0A7J6E4R9_CANSA|nr:hypothetical protein G4B88_012562 [Cannabis sativa]